MANFFGKCARYLDCYAALAFTRRRPNSLEDVIDFCADRPILMGQVRSEIVRLGKILQVHAPKRSLEIGTNYGGTLFLTCTVSSPGATIISVDLPSGPFGGGYPLRKVPLFRRFPTASQRLHLLRANSHSPKTKEKVSRILAGQLLDYLFIDADHTYQGVKNDFEMYSPLVRSGGIVALHDIAVHQQGSQCEVGKFWSEIKLCYRHLEIVEANNGSVPVAITGAAMDTSGLGVLFMS
jgi:predicted O-methyltransferase YrrM